MAEFEWDGNKAAANWHDHGVTFAHAAKACLDPFAVELIDDREDYGEERINLLRMSGGVLLHVTYTERGSRIRLIVLKKSAGGIRPRIRAACAITISGDFSILVVS